ncbi:MAG: hypothetical protein KF724_08215 [Phycisphaeraceae bacterium]|nr:hypothetical protein [Phycisphaeraceae bacterium]
MGQAIGRDTTATLIGTGVGAGVGYLIGNEVDKSRAAELSRQQEARIASLEAQQRQQAAQQRGGSAPAPSISAAGEARFTNTEVGPLGETRWAVVSVNPRDAFGSFASMLVEFRPNGRLLTTITAKDGLIRTADEGYRVVNDTLIINRSDHLINARFSLAGDQLIVSADRFSVVLQRLPG